MNVLKRKNGFLHWDLLGEESVHSVNIVREDECWAVLVFLTTHSSEEEIKVRDHMFNGKGNEAYSEFVDKHFIKFGGVEPDDPEKHRMYIDEIPEVKRFIYEECVQGVRNDFEPITPDILEDAVCVVSTVHDVFYPEEDMEVEFKSSHHLDMSSVHSLAYEECVENRSSEELLEVEIDFKAIEKVYNSSIYKVEGFLVGDEQCMNSNREKWVGKIPFEYKYTAVDEAFKPSSENR